MAEYSGWLLDLYEDPLGGVVLWLLDENGQRRRLRQRFSVTFYVSGAPGRLRGLERMLRSSLSAALSTRWDARRDVFARCDVPVLAVDVRRPVQVREVFQAASHAFPDLTYADADLQLSLRYGAATGVFPLSRCKVVVDPSGFIQSIAPLDTPWDLDPIDPPLRVMSLEPECNPAHATPRLLHVQYDGCKYTFSLTPARSLLVNLRALLAGYDPDLILTTWGDTWLLPYLLCLAEEHGLALPFNREPDSSVIRRKERWYFSYGQIVYRGEQVHLFGRWHIDRANAMLWSDYDISGVLETTRVTGLPLQTAARVSPGTGISSIQMYTALQLNILVPWQKQQVEQLRPSYDLFAADQGGLVYQPIPGVHHDVAEIDFISLYPAIMVYCNISPETLNCPGPASEQVPGLNLMIDTSHEGLVPKALRPLLEKRVSLKRRQAMLPTWDDRRQKDKQRASALKWLLVTCFGYLGYRNARFGRIEAHQAVTAYGREALLRAKETAEDMGYEVLQMYVDALWVRKPGELSDLNELLDEISVRSGLPIALDGVYRWLVFLPSRVNERRSVANRYFGVFQSGEIKMRGIAARRKDTAPWIAQAQMELIEILAGSPEPANGLPRAFAWLRRCLTDLRAGQVPLDQLLLSQRITREVEEYRSPSPAARAARQLKEAGKVVKPGQRVRFLYTPGRPGVYAWDLPVRPNPSMLDLLRYKELLLRAALEVLAPFGATEEMIELALYPDCQGYKIPSVEGDCGYRRALPDCR